MTSSLDQARPKTSNIPSLTRRELARTRSQESAEEDDVAHYLDDRRQQALREVDEAQFGPFHIRVVIVAGVGFMAQAYDVFAISIASMMLGYLYGSSTDPACQTTKCLSYGQDLALKVATSVGTLVGHLFFGWAADIVGRKHMYGYELAIITIATFTQALAGSAAGLDIIAVLAFWRFMMGVGVGGDYPLSAVISAEFASAHLRGRLMTAVFAFQGLGNLLASIVAIVVVSGYRHREYTDINAIEPMWRLLIGLGCVPSAAAMYFRLTIPETPRFTMDIERNVQQASRDVQQFLDNTGSSYADPDAVMYGRSSAPAGSRKDFFTYFCRWKNAKVLLSASWSWFVADIAFYGLGLNTSVFAPLMLGNKVATSAQTSIVNSLTKLCIGNLVLATGLIPGYLASFFAIDRFGRKPIQFLGFGALIPIFCIMGFAFDHLVPMKDRNPDQAHEPHYAFIFLFCLGNFFQNFGPNVTTFVVPAEIFPTRYRTTAYGITAACGKLGAILSQVMLAGLEKRPSQESGVWVKTLFPVYALFMFTGLLSTCLIPETKGVTLEDISAEEEDPSIGEVALRQTEPLTHSPALRNRLHDNSPRSF